MFSTVEKFCSLSNPKFYFVCTFSFSYYQLLIKELATLCFNIL